MNPVRQLRVVGFLEGVSFLVLLFIAMPLKHLYGQPSLVRVVGSVHGILFLMFVAVLFRVAGERAWPLKRSFAAFLASLVPFGTFVLDRSLKREQDLVS
jgi:integral membrane protein